MARNYPEVAPKLQAFLIFRELSLPTQAFNKKDYAYLGGTPLAGFRHVHLVFGKVILTYQLTATEIRLCALTDHSAIEGKSPTLATFLHGLGSSDFEPFVASQPDKLILSREEVEAIEASLYDCATLPDDRRMLDAFCAAYADEDVWEMLESFVVQPMRSIEKRQAILRAFDPHGGLSHRIGQILRQTART